MIRPRILFTKNTLRFDVDVHVCIDMHMCLIVSIYMLV